MTTPKIELLITYPEIVVSLYDDGESGPGSFASARLRVDTQIRKDNSNIGPPTTDWQEIKDQDALKKLLGETAVTQRAHVDRVENQIIELRRTHRAEIAEYNKKITDLEAKIEELEAELEDYRATTSGD